MQLPQIRLLVIAVDNWPPALVVLSRLQELSRSGTAINLERFEIHRVGRPYVIPSSFIYNHL